MFLISGPVVFLVSGRMGEHRCMETLPHVKWKGFERPKYDGNDVWSPTNGFVQDQKVKLRGIILYRWNISRTYFKSIEVFQMHCIQILNFWL